jgi:transcription elongation factor Elf1
MNKEKIKKVVATVKEVYVEPEFEAIFECPYCGSKDYEEIFDDNVTITRICWNNKCSKKYKVKIPKIF